MPNRQPSVSSSHFFPDEQHLEVLSSSTRDRLRTNRTAQKASHVFRHVLLCSLPLTSPRCPLPSPKRSNHGRPFGRPTLLLPAPTMASQQARRSSLMVVDLADSDLIPVLVVGELAGQINDLEAVPVECRVFLPGPQILDLDLMGLALAVGPWERSAFGRLVPEGVGLDRVVDGVAGEEVDGGLNHDECFWGTG